MRNSLFLGVAILFFTVLNATAGVAVLDQNQYTFNGSSHFHSANQLAQTFTCGFGGQLAYVAIYLDTWERTPPNFPTTVSIVETNNGIPSGAVLGSVTTHVPSVGHFKFDLSTESIILSLGSQYGIVVSNSDDSSGDTTDALGIQFNSNKYTGGELWKWKPTTGWEKYTSAAPGYIIGNGDMYFNTWMTPIPEPCTIAFLTYGALFLKRRKTNL